MYNKPLNSGTQVEGEDEDDYTKYDKPIAGSKQQNKKGVKAVTEDERAAKL
jgi:hypothetical protein